MELFPKSKSKNPSFPLCIPWEALPDSFGCSGTRRPNPAPAFRIWSQKLWELVTKAQETPSSRNSMKILFKTGNPQGWRQKEGRIGPVGSGKLRKSPSCVVIPRNFWPIPSFSLSSPVPSLKIRPHLPGFGISKPQMQGWRRIWAPGPGDPKELGRASQGNNLVQNSSPKFTFLRDPRDLIPVWKSWEGKTNI